MKRMNLFRRGLLLALSAAMIASCVAGCTPTNNEESKPAKTEEETTKPSKTENETSVLASESETDKPTESESEGESQSAMDLTEPETVPFDYDQEYILKDIYADDFMVGTIYNGYFSDPEAAVQFNQVTSENFMKPDAIGRSKGNYSWGNGDAFITYAKKNDFAAHGHVLIWHGQTPNWFNASSSMTKEEALDNMKTYIYDVIAHYGADVVSWDVVNEAFDDGKQMKNDDYTTALRSCNWKSRIGDDYLEYAFTYAAEALEANGLSDKVKLYYNDYNLDSRNKAAAVAQMVKTFKEKGIRIDGVGMQGHYNANTSVSNVTNSIAMFRAAGISEVSVSELDVNMTEAKNKKLTEEQEIQQAQIYAQLFQVYKENADLIARITFWQHIDEYSWRSEGCPCIYNKAGKKESFYAVADPDAYLAAHPPGANAPAKEGVAMYGTPDIDGEMDDIWNNTPAYDVNRQLTAWQGATAKVRVLWDENNLYVLMTVKDSVLNKSAAEKYNQDSVEVFLDPGNEKWGFYGSDDGQYRVNYVNEVSYGTVPDDHDVTSAVKEISGGYQVEMAIPLVLTPFNGKKIGFDCQVNDANASGTRQGVAKFSDPTDNSYQSTEKFGTLTLQK